MKDEIEQNLRDWFGNDEMLNKMKEYQINYLREVFGHLPNETARLDDMPIKQENLGE